MNFSYQWVPTAPKGARYFVKYGATTKFNKGFSTREQVIDWIENLEHIAWRVGFCFRIKGDEHQVSVVTRKGEVIKP